MRWLSRLFRKTGPETQVQTTTQAQDQTPGPWVPWTLARRQEVKKLLADKAGHEVTIDDRLLAVELIVQQIADNTIIPSQDYYEKFRSGMRKQIEGGPPPQKWKPDVSRDEIVVPVEVRRRIYAIYRSHGALMSSVRGWFSYNYQVLESGRQNGYTEAIGNTVYDEWCPIAKEKISGKSYRIEDLMSAYETGSLSFPMLPHPECPHFQIDGGSWCRCTWRATKRPLPPGVDPKFAEWLDKELAKPWTPEGSPPLS